MVFYGWWMILVMDIIYMIHSGLWYYGLSAFIIPLTQEFVWTRTEISLGISLSKVDSGIDGPIVGWMSDHIGTRWTTIFCLAISGVLFISLSLINSLWSFYALMLIIFVLPTSPFTAMATAVAQWFDRKAGTAMGLYSIGGALTGLISPVLVWIIVNYGWRTACTLAGTFILLCIPLSFTIKNYGPEHYGLLPDGEVKEEKSNPQRYTRVPDPAQRETLREFTLREALKDKSYWLITIAYSLSNFATQAIILHLLPHLINIGFEPGLAALGMTIVTLSSALGRFGFGWLGDIFKKRYVFALSFAIMLVGCIAFTNASAPWAVFLALATFGPGMGGMFVSRISIQREYYGREHWGITQGFLMLISSVPTFLGPIYAGWMFDNYGSYVPAFMPLTLLWITAIVLMVMARPPQR